MPIIDNRGERPPVADYRGPFLFNTTDTLHWRQRISREEAASERLQKLIKTNEKQRSDGRKRQHELLMPKPCYAFSKASLDLASPRLREKAAQAHLYSTGSWLPSEADAIALLTSPRYTSPRTAGAAGEFSWRP